MPTYTYRCPSCSKTFDRILRLAEYRAPQHCSCGSLAERVLMPPAIHADTHIAYHCPVTGKYIEGRHAHEENLRRHGCRVLEAGETSSVTAARAKEEAALESAVERTAEEFVSRLPSRQVEQLASELQAGADVTINRL